MTDLRKHRASGWIHVTTFESKPCDHVGPFMISEAKVTEEFSGDIVGTGLASFIMVNEPDGTAHFTGMECFSGTLGGRPGSFIFQNSGILRNGELRSMWRVIPGSGTKELTGLLAEGGCTSEGYALEYWFE